MKKEKILIVDDYEDNRTLLAQLVEREGYKAFQADDGVEALQIAIQEQPSLILSDILMPVMDGYELLKKIKDRKIPTRVVMISAERTTTTDIVQAIKAGACDFLVKPVTPTHLRNVIRRVLAVETTLNLCVSETPPIIEQLIAETQKLETDLNKLRAEKNELIGKNEELQGQLKRKSEEFIGQLRAREHVHQLTLIAIRLLCLVIAIAITILLHSLKIITNTQALLLPFFLFILLILPIERVRKVSVKVPKAETGFEIDRDAK